MGRRFWWMGAFLLGIYLAGVGVAGWFLLPPLLLNAPVPRRTETEREALRRSLAPPDSRWSSWEVAGGQGVPLQVWRLHRPRSLGVVIFLHGFGDDAWGSLGRAPDLADWDAVGFTFRGRDQDARIPCTLGGWERADVAAVVRALEGHGVPRSHMVLAAWSQGAGVALLALKDLERQGGALGGALLECPFEDLHEAARNHVRLLLGAWEPFARPAEWLGLWKAGRMAGFDPVAVSPREAGQGLRTPVALVTGDADIETPVQGVQAIARSHPDLTVVAGAGHCQASGRLPGGWGAWATERLRRWGLQPPVSPARPAPALP